MPVPMLRRKNEPKPKKLNPRIIKQRNAITGEGKGKHIHAFVDAAGLVVLLKEDCQTCLGTGADIDNPSSTITEGHRCFTCGGRGWNPTQEAIYAAANVLAVNDMQKGPPDMLAEIGPDLAAPYLALAKDQLAAVLSMGDTTVSKPATQDS